MTSIASIIQDAYRESGIIEVGVDPAAEQFAEGFRRLDVIISALFGTELGEELTTVSFGTAGLSTSHRDYDYSTCLQTYFIPSNIRLLFNIDTATTIYLDPNPRNGARFGVIDNRDSFSTTPLTVNANGRSIDGSLSTTLSVNGEAKEWFYRADTGNWVQVSPLTSSSDSPFPVEFDDLLITMLAIRLNTRVGATTSPETIGALKSARTRFRAKYRQKAEMHSEEALIRMHPFLRRGGFWNTSSTFPAGCP